MLDNDQTFFPDINEHRLTPLKKIGSCLFYKSIFYTSYQNLSFKLLDKMAKINLKRSSKHILPGDTLELNLKPCTV